MASRNTIFGILTRQAKQHHSRHEEHEERISHDRKISHNSSLNQQSKRSRSSPRKRIPIFQSRKKQQRTTLNFHDLTSHEHRNTIDIAPNRNTEGRNQLSTYALKKRQYRQIEGIMNPADLAELIQQKRMSQKRASVGRRY